LLATTHPSSLLLHIKLSLQHFNYWTAFSDVLRLTENDLGCLLKTLGTDHAQKTQLPYCWWRHSIEKPASSIVTWRVCWKVFSGLLPSNGLHNPIVLLLGVGPYLRRCCLAMLFYFVLMYGVLTACYEGDDLLLEKQYRVNIETTYQERKQTQTKLWSRKLRDKQLKERES
jgi:hypothetical protein